MNKISLYLQTRGVAPVSAPLRSTGRNADLPFLGPHAPESVGDIKCRDLFVVLKLEELVSPMSGHVDKDVGSRVGHQPL